MMLQVFHLGGDLLPAINGTSADRRMLPDTLNLRIHLHRQLARGDKNDRLRGNALMTFGKQRNPKRGGLAGARAPPAREYRRPPARGISSD